MGFFREGLRYVYYGVFQTLFLEKLFTKENNKFYIKILFKSYCFSYIIIFSFLAIKEFLFFIFEGANFYNNILMTFARFLTLSLLGLLGAFLLSTFYSKIDVFGFGLAGIFASGFSAIFGFNLDQGVGGGVIVGAIIGLSFGGISTSLSDVSKKAIFLVALGLCTGLVVVLPKVIAEDLNYIISIKNYSFVFLVIFSLLYYRYFYFIAHFTQYLYSKVSYNPFKVLKNSPVYFDQMIRMPLWGLDQWLVDLYNKDNELGLKEIEFIIEERPFQAKLAYKALAQVLALDFDQYHQLKKLSTIKSRLEKLPSESKAFPAGFKDARQNLLRTADLVQDYNLRQTPTGKIKVLGDLIAQLSTFQSVMKLTSAPVGTSFEPLATRWFHWAIEEKAALEQSTSHQSLPNPYIFGSPLQKRDGDLFVGRQDILLAIENYILNTNLRPSLLLYGRRRTGKSSTLLNLPNTRFEPIYIDCQDAKWHESDAMFCYNLVQDIYRSLIKSGTHQGILQPKLESYEKTAFTQLDQFLESVQVLLQKNQKRLLLAFDEYEALGEALKNQYITERVLGKLRNIIQHQQDIVVLVSGSHRFEELTELNWASYLINTQTLELSFLDPDSARQLLTEPVPNLQYETGVVDNVIQVTHCQPYLLQAVASELINHLNSKNQTLATLDDAETAYSKVLKSASAYFSDMWRNGNTEVEQTLMRTLALGQVLTLDTSTQSTMNTLVRKEIVLKTEQGYELAIELFARWILDNQC